MVCLTTCIGSYHRWHARLGAQQVARELSYLTRVFKMYLIGERGALAISYSVPSGLKDIRSDFCVLHLGSNDLWRCASFGSCYGLGELGRAVARAWPCRSRCNSFIVAQDYKGCRNGMDWLLTSSLSALTVVCNITLYDCCDVVTRIFALTYWSPDGFWRRKSMYGYVVRSIQTH